MSNQLPNPMVVIAGVISGVAVYVGVNFTTGQANIPTRETVTNISHGLSAPNRDVPYLPKVAAATAGAAQGGYAVCQTCHQADGKGLPGAFPPLAGSEWMTKDPETPIRIVLLGLSGEIEVAGFRLHWLTLAFAASGSLMISRIRIPKL